MSYCNKRISFILQTEKKEIKSENSVGTLEFLHFPPVLAFVKWKRIEIFFSPLAKSKFTALFSSLKGTGWIRHSYNENNVIWWKMTVRHYDDNEVMNWLKEFSTARAKLRTMARKFLIFWRLSAQIRPETIIRMFYPTHVDSFSHLNSIQFELKSEKKKKVSDVNSFFPFSLSQFFSFFQLWMLKQRGFRPCKVRPDHT